LTAYFVVRFVHLAAAAVCVVSRIGGDLWKTQHGTAII